MKILIRQFLGKLHSWSVVGWGLAEQLLNSGHEVHLFSTDGIEHLPNNLKGNLVGYCEENQNNNVIGKSPDLKYDCQISYTAMKNFPNYLSNGEKNRFGIWCYEWGGKNVLPTGFAKYYKYCDVLCAPSNFAKQIFIDSGVPENTIKVIPHGIDKNLYNKTTTINLPTKKKFKILANIAQTHLRKNIPGLLAAYGRAFKKNDDVCLIIKGKNKDVISPFDVSLNKCLQNFNELYPDHAEIKIFNQFITDVSELYRSVDCVFTMSFCEGFYFPGLEAIASGKISIAPNYGGQLDFLNKNNSLLVSGNVKMADIKSMYWEPKSNATWFVPDIDDAADKLKIAYNNFEKLNKSISLQKEDLFKIYSWENVAQKFIDLCN